MVDCITDLNLDFLRSRREFLNGTDVELIFHRANNEFVLLRDREVSGWWPYKTENNNEADWPSFSPSAADLTAAALAQEKKDFYLQEVERMYKARLYRQKTSVEANEDPPTGFTARTEDNEEYQYEIQDLCLHVTKIEPSDRLLAYNNQRVRSLPARYLVQEWEMNVFVLPAHENRVLTTRLFGNRVPSKTVYALVTLDQERGTLDSNPEILTHYNLRRFVQRIGGEFFCPQMLVSRILVTECCYLLL